MSDEWSPLAKVYDPIRVATIDGSCDRPHDRAVIRAINAKHTVDKSIESDPKCTIFVARLDFATDEQTLEKHFSKYGTIVSLRLVRDIVTGLSKGYAFIEFKHRSTAREVYERAHNLVIDNRKPLVDYEMGRTLVGWKPRRLGGGFGGKKESGQLRFGCRDRPWRRPTRLKRRTGDPDVGHSSKSSEVIDNRDEESAAKVRKRDSSRHRSRSHRK